MVMQIATSLQVEYRQRVYGTRAVRCLCHAKEESCEQKANEVFTTRSNSADDSSLHGGIPAPMPASVLCQVGLQTVAPKALLATALWPMTTGQTAPPGGNSFRASGTAANIRMRRYADVKNIGNYGALFAHVTRSPHWRATFSRCYRGGGAASAANMRPDGSAPRMRCGGVVLVID